MNASMMIINLARRSYATRLPKPIKIPSNPGIQNRLEILEEDGQRPKEITSFDEDLNFIDDEPDFSQLDESYKVHRKELHRDKETLKLRIVSRKYFKNKEPSVLTYMEKEQIRYLNSTDPVEYTAEKLSESFPSLPHTIRKVIKAKWKPKTADRVLKHDQQVIDNWKKFKRGELPLEPRLREHLEKFKNRKISLPNRGEVELKLIPPEPNFPKPKSQMYSGIIQSYLEREKEADLNSVNENLLLADKNNENYKEDKQNHSIESPKRLERDNLTSEIATRNQLAVTSRTKSSESKLGARDEITVDVFFKQAARNIGDTPTLEEKVLLDTYKRKVELDMAKTDERQSKSIGKFDPRLKGGDSVTLLEESDLPSNEIDQKNIASSNDVTKEFGLDTYVKFRQIKACEEEYPESIKIPKNKYQKGKIYQLRDCYYDDDGEFLYRVPGLKS